ncbi:hypothetical protein FisN_5Lh380 [Fistulifera solaris]|uniref:Uncharacterized protein n=1 Tax=Fistulifera solaris TaxID=1519565 RepID=A0A1Z5KGQ1_FISSO|nr:hypothetical protein FisN_5Lh380 [Fistulifera solaris]|eukprot:GAX25295.1 hypothetical protein FisN_5Lh380 [Fistulifera solaris]
MSSNDAKAPPRSVRRTSTNHQSNSKPAESRDPDEQPLENVDKVANQASNNTTVTASCCSHGGDHTSHDCCPSHSFCQEVSDIPFDEEAFRRHVEVLMEDDRIIKNKKPESGRWGKKTNGGPLEAHKAYLRHPLDKFYFCLICYRNQQGVRDFKQAEVLFTRKGLERHASEFEHMIIGSADFVRSEKENDTRKLGKVKVHVSEIILWHPFAGWYCKLCFDKNGDGDYLNARVNTGSGDLGMHVAAHTKNPEDPVIIVGIKKFQPTMKDQPKSVFDYYFGKVDYGEGMSRVGKEKGIKFEREFEEASDEVFEDWRSEMEVCNEEGRPFPPFVLASVVRRLLNRTENGTAKVGERAKIISREVQFELLNQYNFYKDHAKERAELHRVAQNMEFRELHDDDSINFGDIRKLVFNLEKFIVVDEKAIFEVDYAISVNGQGFEYYVFPVVYLICDIGCVISVHCRYLSKDIAIRKLLDGDTEIVGIRYVMKYPDREYSDFIELYKVRTFKVCKSTPARGSGGYYRYASLRSEQIGWSCRYAIAHLNLTAYGGPRPAGHICQHDSHRWNNDIRVLRWIPWEDNYRAENLDPLSSIKYPVFRSKVSIDPNVKVDYGMWNHHPERHLEHIWVDPGGTHCWDDQKKKMLSITEKWYENGWMERSVDIDDAHGLRTKYTFGCLCYEIHNQISLDGKGLTVDHVNNERDDNSKDNLVAATALGQSYNKKIHKEKRTDGTIPGVRSVEENNFWLAQLSYMSRVQWKTFPFDPQDEESRADALAVAVSFKKDHVVFVKEQQQKLADDILHERITLAEANRAMYDIGFDSGTESDSEEAEESLALETDENRNPDTSIEGLELYVPKPLSRKVTGFKKKTNNIQKNWSKTRRKSPPLSLNEILDENSAPTFQDLSNRSS